MNYFDEELEFFQRLYRETMAMMAETSRASITKNSTFTQHINCYIHSVKELQFYQQAQLREVVITRPALIMDIDLNYRAPNGATNAQRLAEGLPPYDPITSSVIDLHHIGQQYDSPFAELPHSVHNAPGLSSLLHQAKKPSWRRNPDLVKQYLKETVDYWRMRGEAV